MAAPERDVSGAGKARMHNEADPAPFASSVRIPRIKAKALVLSRIARLLVFAHQLYAALLSSSCRTRQVCYTGMMLRTAAGV